jgi:hypothetical protein
MSIYHPIKEGYNGILEGDPLLSIGVEIEGHVIVTLDVHESIVQVEDWGEERLMLEVSPE